MGLKNIVSGAVTRWNKAILRDRELYLVISLFASSLVSLLPFAREASISNYLVYSLLPVVLVFANRQRFESVPQPAGYEMAVGIALILGSFGFNSLCGSFTGDYDYGLTDYVILVVGVFSIFYSIGAALVRFGMILLVFLRSVTLGLSVVSASLFAAVSEVFVDMVVSLSRFIVSPDITAGTVSGEIIVGGAAGNSSVFIGWACAGLEELVLISVILYLLIDSFRLSLSKTGVWLALGIAGSFLINILRMVVLVWIAFSRGVEDMLWVHTHLGDVLFLIWIAAFWVVFFKVAKPTSQSTSQ